MITTKHDYNYQFTITTNDNNYHLVVFKEDHNGFNINSPPFADTGYCLPGNWLWLS